MIWLNGMTRPGFLTRCFDGRLHFSEKRLGAAARAPTPCVRAATPLIVGFPGQNEAYMAMEREKIDSYGVTFWSSLTSTKPQWIRDKKIRILLQYGPQKEDELPDVPYGPDLVKNPDDKLLFEAAYAPLAAGRPFVAPPELPAERLAALRTAMLETYKDAAFLAEAEKLQLRVDRPISGENLQAQIAKVYQYPQRVIDRLRKIAQGK